MSVVKKCSCSIKHKHSPKRLSTQTNCLSKLRQHERKLLTSTTFVLKGRCCPQEAISMCCRNSGDSKIWQNYLHPSFTPKIVFSCNSPSIASGGLGTHHIPQLNLRYLMLSWTKVDHQFPVTVLFDFSLPLNIWFLVNSQTNITNLSLTKSKYCSPKTRSRPSNHNQRLLLTIHPLQTVVQGGTSSEADQGSKTRRHIDLGSLAESTAILRNRNPLKHPNASGLVVDIYGHILLGR